jgi:Flp pilus assembly protein TadG
MIRHIKNERGQVIIAAPFIILFLVAGVFFMLNVGAMTAQKIRLQVATDAAARDAAYI